jgi:hypothetical protein
MSDFRRSPLLGLVIAAFVATCGCAGLSSEGDGAGSGEKKRRIRPGLFAPLTEPPCSYCSTQHRKRLVRDDDPVIAWIRASHNGGAIPLRHFLSSPRVINDTYGLFFYDPDGGYVAAYRKDYGYSFHGWRGGVMLARGKDGTLWSALSGRALEGPQKGKRLERIPNLRMTWGHWLMLHPESTAYDLFDGKRYPIRDLPKKLSVNARETMGDVDRRLDKLGPVIGVEIGSARKAYSLAGLGERHCYTDRVGGKSIAVFWYGPTSSAVAFEARVGERELTLFADKVSPETAPFKDRETGTRWTLAGRGVDGPLKGKELTWVPGVQCRWYAWVSENPETELFSERHHDEKR